ncbi:homeobox-DDT domain protein RLT3-like isoform X1 [Chenopodium quinoa]|uniref:homeobox-DDT domain protein RLT3-like isoform X1 n=1 Tax=Chenopodium quinoa TaxID=63459 RepID=UPI000B7877AD|nr:homeobox-DDT domain protein RLT3-like isoform X1 [Chenopodium quinoa]
MAVQFHHNNGAFTLSPPTTLNDFDEDNDAGYTLFRKNPLQLQTLEYLYIDDKNPTQSRLEDYSSALGLTYEQVRRWYVERRRRDDPDAGKNIGVNRSVQSTAKGKSKMKKKKNLSSLELGEPGDCTIRPGLIQDMLYSSDYIFKKIFRKDGPPLGVEFDPIPETTFQGRNDIPDSRCCEVACQGEQRALKRRKVTKSAVLEAEQWNRMKTPMKKHGKGKGLMSDLQLVNYLASFRDNVGASKRGKMLARKNSQPGKTYGMGKGFMTASQLVNPDSKRRPLRRKPAALRRSVNKVQEKKKPIFQRRKVDSSQKATQKARKDCCKIALDLASHDKNLCSFPTKADDEELELMELQAGPNPLTCGAHFANGGKTKNNGCSLCKGLLPKFPPESVRMRKPFHMQPWNSSLELEKKLFKALHFLYTYAVILDVYPFTLDDFAKAFLDKDSSLLGKLHVCLLGLLLSDIQNEISNGLSIHSNKNGMFLNFLHMFVMWQTETQDSVVNFWKTSLNPLTWTEILRQVLIAAGFGSKDGNQSKGCLTKETDCMAKYGLQPDTLKGKLFSILFEQGNSGMKVTELAKSSQIADLNLGKTDDELEDSICSILASDITLFEKISSSTYRLRLASIMKKDEDALSDNEDCGSIDDESRLSNSLSNNADCDSGISSSRPNMGHLSPESNPLNLSSVIDESHPGESWLLGLMEGEYSDLSIEEKLNALLALIDLVRAGSSFRMEDPSAVLAECVPRIYQHGSGGKIKRPTVKRPSLLSSSFGDVTDSGRLSSDICAVDSSVVLSIVCKEHRYSSMKKGLNSVGNGDALHPIQTIFLGSDRRYNRYWLFLGPCDADDPGHKQIYVESSEDGQWQVIDSEEALYGLLASLNGQGRREAVLLASLEMRMAFLVEEMTSRIPADFNVSQSTQSGLCEIDRTIEDSLSPISEIDNHSLGETSFNAVTSSGAAPFIFEKKVEEEKKKYERLQAYDSWIWNNFYSNLHAVRCGKRSFFDSWTRCGSCNDLYWRDERHCKACHATFELDFDLEEKYAVHVAKCHVREDADIFPMHKVLPSKLQALKAAIHVIELFMPEGVLIGAWKKSAYKLWVRRLRRTSSLHELLQVLGDFVGSLNVDWVLQCNAIHKCESTVEDFVTHFQNMPQTSSAVALWLVKLDAFIALQLDERVVGTA